jgi:hypothetical protein
MQPTNRVKFLVFNFLGLQLTWAACAYGATHDWPLLGVYVGCAYVVLHFMFVQQRWRDVCVATIIASLGIVLDILNSQLNIISFPNAASLPLLIPFWLMSLWLVFSLTIPHCLYWLEKNMFLAFFAGAVGGSASYWLGQSLGAIDFPQSTFLSVAVYFVEWGILLPVALILVRKLNRCFSTD